MKLVITLLAVFFVSVLDAQERIDGSFPFQSDPDKKYSIYVPSSYDGSVEHELLVAFHPFNVNRWDAVSWRDTLIDFAEMNNLLVIAPDGGADGKVDDLIDTAFTSVLLDSMSLWYELDQEKIYAMGFSWGGKTTYTYGLNNVDKFAGFIPVGAAINGLSELSGIIEEGEDQAFYVVHGSADSPSVRFEPIVNGLEDVGSCVETNLMDGIGHTIDFPNRNQILTEALNWIRASNCGISSNKTIENKFNIFPNPLSQGQRLNIDSDVILKELIIYSIDGKRVYYTDHYLGNEEIVLIQGAYFISIGTENGQFYSSKIIVQD